MREKMPLVCSDDYGKDPESAKMLLQKHLILMESIHAYEDDIHKLSQQSKDMVDANKNNQVRLVTVTGDFGTLGGSRLTRKVSIST